jgi:hypothetical protein
VTGPSSRRTRRWPRLAALGLWAALAARVAAADDGMADDLLTPAPGVPYVVLEDFRDTPPNQLPVGWGWRDKDADLPKRYEVRVHGAARYLAAQDTGSSVILLKPAQWNPRKYPIMTWCWKAVALPPGGDELRDQSNDSAAGVYAIFSTNWLRVPKQIKYVWSTTLPKGTVGRRNKPARPYVFVLESGPENLGRWMLAQADLERDHERVYGDHPPRRTVGLGILTDANSTHSYAEAHYADFRAWPRAALEQGLIDDYCRCLEDAANREQGR